MLADWIVDHLTHVEALPILGQLGISKHVLAMMVVAALLLLIFIPLGNRLKNDPYGAPRGPFVDFFEAILLFMRDEVVRPLLGKEGDRFLPMIWTFFFFILFCNLIGLVPIPIKIPTLVAGEVVWTWQGMVTPTGQAWVTGTLAGIAFLWYHALGIKKQGFVAYMRHICPGGVPLVLRPLIWFLEFAGHFIKAAALCIRLWANMLGGHAVLFAFVGFLFMTPFMAPVSVVAGIAIFFLEIFVAFLQAFVFTFLVVIFLDAALHPH